jgi:hypothetical protein
MRTTILALAVLASCGIAFATPPVKVGPAVEPDGADTTQLPPDEYRAFMDAFEGKDTADKDVAAGSPVTGTITADVGPLVTGTGAAGIGETDLPALGIEVDNAGLVRATCVELQDGAIRTYETRVFLVVLALFLVVDLLRAAARLLLRRKPE